MRRGILRGESAGGGRTFRVLSAHDLLDETKQNGDDDSGLKRLTKDDEENGHGEDGHLELELSGSDLVVRLKEERKSMPKGGRRGGDMEEGVI